MAPVKIRRYARAQKATYAGQGRPQMVAPGLLLFTLQVGLDLGGMALFIRNKFLQELTGRPVRKVIRHLEVMPIRFEQRGLDHPVITRQGRRSFPWTGSLLEELPDGVAHAFARPESGHLPSALPEETGVLGGFPGVLGNHVFQFRFAYAVDQRRASAKKLTLRFKKAAQQLGHVRHGQHAGRRSPRRGF